MKIKAMNHLLRKSSLESLCMASLLHIWQELPLEFASLHPVYLTRHLLVCENDSIGQVIMMTLKIGAIDVLRVQPERIQCPQPELRYRALRRDTLSSW